MPQVNMGATDWSMPTSADDNRDYYELSAPIAYTIVIERPSK